MLTQNFGRTSIMVIFLKWLIKYSEENGKSTQQNMQ